MMRAGWIAALVGLVVTAPAAAVPPIDAYGRLPSVDLIALSPDGSRIAVAVTDGVTREVQVRRLADRQLDHRIATGKTKIRSLQWAGDHHVLITSSTTSDIEGVLGPRREYYLAVDLDLRTHKINRLLNGDVTGVSEKLNTIAELPEVRSIDGKPVAFLVGYSFVGTEGVLTLFRVDLDSRRTTREDVGTGDTEDWLVDDGGRMAARVDYSQRSGHWVLWAHRGGRLAKLMEDTQPVDTPSLVGFGRTHASALVEMRDGDDWSYREIALGGDGPPTPLPALDGAALVTDPRTGVVIGGHRQDGLTVDYTFLADADQKLWAKIGRAFPKAVVRIESWSDDRQRIVLRVEGKAAGAAYYLLDTATRKADWLANEYADIAPEDLGEVRAIEYPAGDGLTIHAFLTLPPAGPTSGLPLVVLPHGGPGVHDGAGFDWWAQALASRGYAVLQPQFRGSTGFGEPFHAAGFGEWGRKMQTDLSDGVAYLAHAGTIDPKRVGIVGGSYGGYAALAGVTLQHGVYVCAVSLAGPADLRAMLTYEETRTGGTKNSTLRFWKRFMGAKSASDPALDAISPIRFAASTDAPVLLIHGTDDTVVPIAQSKAMVAALTKAGHPAKLVTLTTEDHWLSASATRTAMLRATVDFLGQHLPVGTVTASAERP